MFGVVAQGSGSFTQTGLTAATFSVGVAVADPLDGSSVLVFNYDSGGSAAGDPPFTDGDVYGVTITSADGSDLFSGSGSASYVRGTFGTCGTPTCTDAQIDL
jgi:hypothetical protein